MSQSLGALADSAMDRVTKARVLADQAVPGSPEHRLLMSGVFLLEEVALMLRRQVAGDEPVERWDVRC